MVAAAAGLLVATVVVAWRVPSATIIGIALLAVATALAVPAACVAAARLAQRVADRRSWHALGLVGDGLRVRTVRASTLAAMGAVAVCGCVAIEGAHRDVLRGQATSAECAEAHLRIARIHRTRSDWVQSREESAQAQPSGAHRPPSSRRR